MDFYTIMLHAHSGMRWLVTLLVLGAFVKALLGWIGKKEFSGADAKLVTFAMVSTHIQFLLGIILYGLSPLVNFSGMGESADFRVWTAEHPTLMLLAVALITVGRKKSKKEGPAPQQNKKIAIFFGVAILLIILGIPGNRWF